MKFSASLYINFFLKYCSAVELGAFLAYTHHFRSTENYKIQEIAAEELQHYRTLNSILRTRGAFPSLLLPAIIGLLGGLLGFGCYIFPKKWANFVAYVLEKINIMNYQHLSYLLPEYRKELADMDQAEKRHAIFFNELQ